MAGGKGGDPWTREGSGHQVPAPKGGQALGGQDREGRGGKGREGQSSQRDRAHQAQRKVQFQALQWEGRAGEGSQPTRAEDCQALFSLLAAWEPQHRTSGHCKKTGNFCSESAAHTILEPH